MQGLHFLGARVVDPLISENPSESPAFDPAPKHDLMRTSADPYICVSKAEQSLNSQQSTDHWSIC
jgi:hypothetical protein